MTYYIIEQSHIDEGSLQCQNCKKLHYITGFEELLKDGCSCGAKFIRPDSTLPPAPLTYTLEFVELDKIAEVCPESDIELIDVENINELYGIVQYPDKRPLTLLSAGELLLLNTTTHDFGIYPFKVKCHLTPKSESNQIQKVVKNYIYAYENRN